MDLLAAEITARTGKDPGEDYGDLISAVRHILLCAPGFAGDAGTEGKTRQVVARRRYRVEPRRKGDHGQADPSPGQRCSVRRPEGDLPHWLVCRTAVGQGEHL
jgi:hypothetical protein